MVSAKDNFGIKGLHLQTVENRCSVVNRVNFSMDPFQRYCLEETREDDPSLKNFKYLLEWSYGYRNKRHINKNTKRRAPSAGALYPTELMLLTWLNEKWTLLYYSFSRHAFYNIPDPDLTCFLSQSKLNKEESQLYFLSVFTRSVQKYGVRAYRYAYLDASCIADNIARFYAAGSGRPELSLSFPSSELNRNNGLQHGESILFSMTLNNKFSVAESPVFNSPVLVPHNFYSGCAPYASSNLMRVLDFHEKALKPAPITYDWKLTELTGREASYLGSYLEERNSAHEFMNTPASSDTYNNICSGIKSFCLFVNQFLDIHLDIIVLVSHVAGKDSGECTNLTRQEKTDLPEEAKATMRMKLSEACQGQVIMRNTAFTFIVTTPAGTDDESGRHRYTKSIVGAGLICSELYHLGYKYGIGTTTIGGFSEKMINKIYGNENILPLVVQTFGNADNHQLKVDAVKTIIVNI